MALYRLLSLLDRSRFDSSVVSLIPMGPLGEKLRALGTKVHSLEMRRGRLSASGLLRLTRWLYRERPDVIQTWLYHADLMGLLAARMARTPVTVWNLRASNMDMKQYSTLSGLTLRACARLSHLPTAVVANSEAGITFHTQRGYHPRQWILIPNGIDTQQFKPDADARLEVRRELGLGPDALVIGLVARLDPMKDHTTFFQAAIKLTPGEQPVHFVLVGEGIEADNEVLAKYTHEKTLAGRLHLLGCRTDMPRLTAALDIATSSSCSEGFPNVVAEAMACGVPCVVTNVGDSARIVSDTGHVVPPKNPAALADGWSRLIELGATGRSELGRLARDRICQVYSLQKSVRQYEDLYASLTEGRPCAA